MIQQSIGNNTEWKNAYKEGFADGYAAAKKEMNYTNFPPVYYGTPNVGNWGTNPAPKSTTSTTRATGYGHPSEQHFVTGMTMASSDC